MHGKDEAPHRPFYGRPMDEQTAAIPDYPAQRMFGISIDQDMELAHVASLIRAERYSCVPATGLNLVMCSAMPIGLLLAASTCIAVQVMFVEVAAMAAVPWKKTPTFRGKAPYTLGSLVDTEAVFR